MSDAFLVLAQTPDGLTCFFLPRVLPDGTRNASHIQRLKDKLGNRANASSEVGSTGRGHAGSARRAEGSERSSTW
jgi:putative acyl-CoA dehydrogenase